MADVKFQILNRCPLHLCQAPDIMSLMNMPCLSRKFKSTFLFARSSAWCGWFIGVALIAWLATACQHSSATRGAAPGAEQTNAAPRPSGEAAGTALMTPTPSPQAEELPQIVA